mgnify:FL=1
MGIRMSRKFALGAALRLGAEVWQGGKHMRLRFNGKTISMTIAGSSERDMPPVEAKRVASLFGMTVEEFKKA